MSGARIDHAALARKHIDWAHEQQSEEGRFDETVQHNATLAVAEATLALVEQQRIANLIALGQFRVGAHDLPHLRHLTIEPNGEHGIQPVTEIREGLGL